MSDESIGGHGLPRRAAVGAIRLYQRYVSPVLGARCRFYPSCSSYAAEAIGRYGLVHGGWLAARRLSRCHPWNPGGFDYVPGTHAESHEDTAAPSTPVG